MTDFRLKDSLQDTCSHIHNKHPDGDWYFCDINDKPCPFTDNLLECEYCREEQKEND